MTGTEEKITALMALAANYGKEFPESLLGIWLDLLKPYPVELVNAGVRAVIESYAYKTLPPFALLRQAMDKVAGVLPQEKNVEAQAAAEWTALLEAIEQRGSYGGPPPDMHPTTAYVLRSFGGWDNACRWSTAWLDAKRRDFIGLWVQAHGKTDAMALGADAVKAALTTGTGSPAGAESARAILGRLALDGQEVRQ